MQTIQVNSAACGTGKTTQWIYPEIRKLLALREHILLVVPSKELQRQYAREFGVATVINSDNADSVAQDIYRAFELRDDLIIITHQAFQELRIPYRVKQDYHLIIDEVFDPYRRLEIDLTAKWLLDYKFDEIYTPTEPELYSAFAGNYDDNWYKFDVARYDDVEFLRDSKKWKMLQSPVHNTYMRYDHYTNLINQDRVKIDVMQELRADTLYDWCSLKIAAAAFKNAFMHFWMKSNNIDYKVVGEFIPPSTSITLHLPEEQQHGINQKQPQFKWSKYKQKNTPEIVNIYHDYIRDNADEKNVLCVRNNSANKKIWANEFKVNHNVHGMNYENRAELTAVSLETALNPNPALKDFLIKHVGMNNSEITNAFAAYLFYQIIMRTAIRDGNPIDVFLLDDYIALELIGYFDNITLKQELEVTALPKKPRKSDNPNYNRDRQRARRAKIKATLQEEEKKVVAENTKSTFSKNCYNSVMGQAHQDLRPKGLDRISNNKFPGISSESLEERVDRVAEITQNMNKGATK